MLAFSLAFLLGDWLLHQQHQLPTISINIAFIIASILICVLVKNNFIKLIVIGLLFGFIYSAFYAAFILKDRIPHDLEGVPLKIEGYIASIPHQLRDTQAFLFAVKKMKSDEKLLPYQPTIKLYFKTNEKIVAGSYWRFQVRLKRIHGLQNPGGEDYESYALSNKILATGSVLTKFDHQKIAEHHSSAPLIFLRQKLLDHLMPQLSISHVTHWLIALIMGERVNVPSSDWEILRRTGTNHLMAIAGLHVGIISGLTYSIVLFVIRRVTYIVARVPAQYIAMMSALIVGLLYAALAGFSIPTQRAAIMLTVGTIFMLQQRNASPWFILSSAILIVLLVNPFVVLSDSFWLSFSTIAWIFYCMSGRLSPKGVWWKYGRIQWIIGIGLIPLSLFFFKECSLISFVANTIAIPWLAILLLPWLLLGTVLSLVVPDIAHYLFLYCDWSLSLLWRTLTWMSHLPLASVDKMIATNAILISTSIAIIIFLMPAGIRCRRLALLWCLPLLTYSTVKPTSGDVWMTLLDVGQGLSVVVQTANHVLLYDAGPRLASHDSGESVIIPYLKHQQIKVIDMMMISHGDNDHLGGAESVYSKVIVKQIKTSMPAKITYAKADFCLQHDTWQWDGVIFSVLYPSKENLGLGNDSSCVLMIDTGKYRILLTGDIESYAEEILLQSTKKLTADIIVAPHHGSKTSSTEGFIQSVSPQYVLYAVGYRNRYHFPHNIIQELYKKYNASSLASDRAGAIEIKLEREAGLSTSLYREKYKRYWHDD